MEITAWVLWLIPGLMCWLNTGTDRRFDPSYLQLFYLNAPCFLSILTVFPASVHCSAAPNTLARGVLETSAPFGLWVNGFYTVSILETQRLPEDTEL